jgi:hypothetical protein
MDLEQVLVRLPTARAPIDHMAYSDKSKALAVSTAGEVYICKYTDDNGGWHWQHQLDPFEGEADITDLAFLGGCSHCLVVSTLAGFS